MVMTVPRDDYGVKHNNEDRCQEKGQWCTTRVLEVVPWSVGLRAQSGGKEERPMQHELVDDVGGEREATESPAENK